MTQLEQARRVKAVDILAGGVVHDFNNVLQATSSDVQLLMMRGDLDGGIQDTLAGISNLVQRAVEMIQQLLTISRKREVKLAPVLGAHHPQNYNPGPLAGP
ncbi:hypothetical protein DFAR_1510005 [Desulfarculales bacterium]